MRGRWRRHDRCRFDAAVVSSHLRARPRLARRSCRARRAHRTRFRHHTRPPFHESPPRGAGVAVCAGVRAAGPALFRRSLSTRAERARELLTDVACGPKITMAACACAWHVHGMCMWHVHGVCTPGPMDILLSIADMSSGSSSPSAPSGKRRSSSRMPTTDTSTHTPNSRGTNQPYGGGAMKSRATSAGV